MAPRSAGAGCGGTVRLAQGRSPWARTGRPLPSSGTRTRGRGQRGLFVVLMFAALHPPQRAGMPDEVGRQGPVNRSCLGYDAGDCLAYVWVAPDLAFQDGFVWYTPKDVPAELTIPSSIYLRWFVCRVEGDYGQLDRSPLLMAMSPSVSAWSSRKQAMLSLQR